MTYPRCPDCDRTDCELATLKARAEREGYGAEARPGYDLRNAIQDAGFLCGLRAALIPKPRGIIIRD